jgi:uncharacterized protein
MLLDISKALKAPGVSFGFSISESFQSIYAGGEEIHFLKPVDVSGSYIFTGDNFFLNGTVVADYSAQCCRCLKDVLSSMSVSFEEEFVKFPDEEHPDKYLYRGEQLDLSQMVGDIISLNTPMRHLCSEDCRGLCPVCGIDRNITKCDCDIADQGDDTM